MVNPKDAPAPLLDVRDVTFGYGKQPIFYDVRLKVRAGEMLGLLGPNGSGKTTLLRLLSGVLSPQHGEILLEGRNLRAWGRRGIARKIAVVPQELHMPFAYTVAQMVDLGRTPFISLLGSAGKADQEIVRDAIEITDISPLADRVFNELSGGERQRVMVAMALAQQPGLLLLDEPTAHLDIKYQVETLELAQRLNRERGVTIIAALHDLNLAARYFPRLVLFQRGIVADAGPAEVLEPGLLSRVYGVNVQVGILRGAEHLSVLPPGSRAVEPEREEAAEPRVHVVAGGGSGELAMRALADEQIPFAAGPLNIGDSDHTLALRLARDIITEQPYAPIAPESLTRMRASLARVAVLLLCPMPIGPGNVALLREAVTAAQQGLPVILLEPLSEDGAASSAEALRAEVADRFVARDYTGGEGSKLLHALLAAGAHVVGSVTEALALVKRDVHDA